MSGPVEVGPGCTVEAEQHERAVTGVSSEVEVSSDGSCAWLRFPLPAGASLAEVDARELRHDGTRLRLDATRWEVSPRDPDGDAVATLHVPDLWKLDRVRVRLVREGTSDEVALAWLAGRSAPDGGLLPAVLESRSRVLTLVVPPGKNPQLTLHPEGAASSHVDETLRVAPSDEVRGFVVESPPGAVPTLRAEPAGVAELRPVGGSWQVRLSPSEASTRLTLSWDDEASPTHGERLALDELTVVVDEGSVRWEGDRWSLEKVRGEWIVPSREALLSGLDRRFRFAAIPEPSIPGMLRGAPSSDAILADLRPTLAVRAATLPAFAGADPLFVRPLSKARKSGALSPTEAAAIQWLYARQLRFDAHWAFARPASTETLAEDAPDPVSPAGYDVPLLVVVTGAGDRWLDPSCGSCGPFELRPDLEGARVLSPSGRTRTPPPTPGKLGVVVGADTVTLTAEGPPALLLRRMVGEASDRRSALASRVGGPGATLRSVEGLDEAGAPIVVVTTRGTGLTPDPTALPVAADDGTWWFDWVGERTFVGPGDEVSSDISAPGIHAAVRSADGQVQRTLQITQRRVAVSPELLAPPVSRPPPDPDPTSPSSAPSSP